MMSRSLTYLLAGLLVACAPAQPQKTPGTECAVSIFILGVAQDGGKPQIANPADPAWEDPTLRRLATSLALIDRRGGKTKRWLFEATPDIKEQLQRLDEAAPADRALGLNGIFLTHAHIGHYAGLMMLGHEAAGAQNISVYVMPRMADFLAQNGPWSQLVNFHNILLAIMAEGEAEQLGDDLSVTPFLVPHRQEFSEVAGYKISGPEKSALFIPDIDSWEDWDQEGIRVEDMISDVDAALLDATFFADGEIPGRDMSGFPHPFVSHSMERFSPLAPEQKLKVRFIHMNHTNPLHDFNGKAHQTVIDAGFGVASEGDEICL